MYATTRVTQGIPEISLVGDKFYERMIPPEHQESFMKFSSIEKQFKTWWPTFTDFVDSLVPVGLSSPEPCLWCIGDKNEYKEPGLPIRAIKTKRLGKVEASLHIYPICVNCLKQIISDIYGEGFDDDVEDIYSDLVEAAVSASPNIQRQENLLVVDEGKQYVVCPKHLAKLMSGEAPVIQGTSFDTCYFCTTEEVEKVFKDKAPHSKTIKKAKAFVQKIKAKKSKKSKSQKSN